MSQFFCLNGLSFNNFLKTKNVLRLYFSIERISKNFTKLCVMILSQLVYFPYSIFFPVLEEYVV
jgi:hypothetical protein